MHLWQINLVALDQHYALVCSDRNSQNRKKLRQEYHCKEYDRNMQFAIKKDKHGIYLVFLFEV